MVGYIAVNQTFQKFYFLIVSFPLWSDRFPPLVSLNCKIFWKCDDIGQNVDCAGWSVVSGYCGDNGVWCKACEYL